MPYVERMTPIRPDLPTIRELGRGLPVGGSRSGLLCPKCGGGKTRERSLSVYRNEAGVGGRCHRASCPLNVFRPDVTGDAVRHAAPAFNPNPYPYPLTLPDPEHKIWDLLHVSVEKRTPELAARLGVMARAEILREVVWVVRDYQWVAKGHVSRLYPDKYIRTWRVEDKPFTAFHGLSKVRVLWIVEDMVSAARIALEGGNALALLGTNFSLAGQRELGEHLSRIKSTLGSPLVRVALDPDAVSKGALLARELTNRLGYDTILTPMNADPKDLERGALRELVRQDLTPGREQ